MGWAAPCLGSWPVAGPWELIVELPVGELPVGELPLVELALVELPLVELAWEAPVSEGRPASRQSPAHPHC